MTLQTLSDFVIPTSEVRVEVCFDSLKESTIQVPCVTDS